MVNCINRREQRLNGPQGVAVDQAGNVYVADTGNHTIREITSAGVVSTIAGVAGSAGGADGTSGARFNQPAAIAVDGVGNIYVTDLNGLRQITQAGEVSTIAAGIGASAIALDGAGNLYVTQPNPGAVPDQARILR